MSRKILLISATSLEIEPVLNILADINFLDASVTGIGTGMTMFHLARAYQQGVHSGLICAGVGGSFDRTLTPGSVVEVQRDRFGDLGVWESNRFTDVFEMNLLGGSELPFEGGWLPNQDPLIRTGLEKTTAITVNTLLTDNKMIRSMKDKYRADIESMEGAAAHYFCLSLGIPFVHVRAISNIVGERDKSKWKMDEAIANLNEHLIALVNHLQ